MRSSANNFLLDGLDNNSYQIGNQGFNNQALTPSVDGVQEYKIITSNFPAQYGRAGGAIINVSTRSGTNKLHVSAWEFIRNTAFDAYGPLYGTGVKPGLIQNQFGVAFGGRIERDKHDLLVDAEQPDAPGIAVAGGFKDIRRHGRSPLCWGVKQAGSARADAAALPVR